MKLTRGFVLLALAVLRAPSLAGQSVDDLKAGIRVRVHGLEPSDRGDKSYYLSGQIVGRDSTHLHVIRDGATAVDTLPYFAISNIQVKTGDVTRTQLVLGSAATGALSGVALWLALKVFQSDGSTRDQLNHDAAISIPILTVGGLVFGALAGTEQWVSVHVPGALKGGRQ